MKFSPFFSASPDHKRPGREDAAEGCDDLMLKKMDSRSASFRIQMLFDKLSHGFVGFANFLLIAASKPMFSGGAKPGDGRVAYHIADAVRHSGTAPQ